MREVPGMVYRHCPTETLKLLQGARTSRRIFFLSSKNTRASHLRFNHPVFNGMRSSQKETDCQRSLAPFESSTCRLVLSRLQRQGTRPSEHVVVSHRHISCRRAGQTHSRCSFSCRRCHTPDIEGGIKSSTSARTGACLVTFAEQN